MDDSGNVATNELAQLELLCEAFYGGDAVSQSEAHAVLLPLLNNPSNISKFQAILARSTQPQALLFATSGLNKLFTQFWLTVPDSDKEASRKFLLNYLYCNGDAMLLKAPIILGHLIRLLCRIVKLQWLESLTNQNIVEQVDQFLKGSVPQWVIGLEIYTYLTEDMQPTLGANMARNRRTAISFRDTALANIIKTAIETITQFLKGTISMGTGMYEEETKLLAQVLKLTNNCLSFDFMGTVADDTTEEQSTVMIPYNWTVLKDENIPKTFFELYNICWSSRNGPPRRDCARLCLSALVLISAVRRSFFTKDEERTKFIGDLVAGTAQILSLKLGLDDDACYHDLCRLLGKINANQFSELMQCEHFNSWISQVYELTISSLREWRYQANSKHYLLQLWSNLVNPLLFIRHTNPSFRGDHPGDMAGPSRTYAVQNQIQTYIHEVTLAYIESRMKLAEVAAVEGDTADFENPLHHEVLRTEQLEVLGQLGRCRYCEAATTVSHLFTQTRQERANLVIDQKVFEEKISWLVYMIGSLINGNISHRFQHSRLQTDESSLMTNGGEGKDDYTTAMALNAELSSQVFTLMKETDTYSETPETLELAYLHFLEHFKKICINEHGKTQARTPGDVEFAKKLGVSDNDGVLDLVVKKIGVNLQTRTRLEMVIKKTLNLLYDLGSAINIVHTQDRCPHMLISGKLMLQNKTVRYVLENHADPTFTFLLIPRYMKFRTHYYLSLAKLVFMDVRSNVDKFNSFMAPMTRVFDTLWDLCGGGTNPEALKSAHCKLPLIGLVRDLRGICMACNSSENYILMFQWMVNKPKQPNQSRIHLFTTAADVLWNNAEVIIPVLKMISEFVYNKAQRIHFVCNSANGNLLFNQITCILLNYGNRILEEQNFTNMYKEKYKGIAVALEMFCHGLSGGYVNFGMFELYKDMGLDNSLALGLRMCLAIPHQDLQAYIKALKPYYSFLELTSRQFMPQVMSIGSPKVSTLLRSLEDGLCSFESGVSLQACSTLDNIITYLYEHQHSTDMEFQDVPNFLNTEIHYIRRLFQLLFQLVLSGEFSSTWSMSRPLLGLILLCQSEFEQLKQGIVNSHADNEKKIKLNDQFDQLMTNVEPQLDSKNKDAFTRNLYSFAAAVRSTIS